MNKIHRWLLIILTFLYANTLFAQINLNIEVHGVNSEIEGNIRLYLSIEQQKEHELLSEGRLRHIHKKAPQEITLALQPFGYYRPKIKSELIKIAAQQWKAIYSIDLGPPLPIAEFNNNLSDEIRIDTELKKLNSEE